MVIMVVKVKVQICATVESNAADKSTEMAPLHGYRSRSDLVNHLLVKWVENPIKKEVSGV